MGRGVGAQGGGGQIPAPLGPHRVHLHYTPISLAQYIEPNLHFNGSNGTAYTRPSMVQNTLDPLCHGDHCDILTETGQIVCPPEISKCLAKCHPVTPFNYPAQPTTLWPERDSTTRFFTSIFIIKLLHLRPWFIGKNNLAEIYFQVVHAEEFFKIKLTIYLHF